MFQSKTIFALLCLLLTGTAVADEKTPSDWDVDEWSVAISFYTKHFDPEPDHVNDQNLLAVEAGFHNNWLAGIAVFDNSFGQDSQFLYAGYSWPIMRSDYWYVKLMGGLLHGYKEPYEDKIPLNGLGVAPAIVPALGFKYRRVFAEANLGGLAVITLVGGFRF